MSEKLSVQAVSRLMEPVKNEAVKDSWRFVFRELRIRRDEETALMFVQLHAKSATCRTCGLEEMPIVKVVQKASDTGQFHVGAYCPKCGIWFRWLGYELKTKRV